ncbi:hypothetical protein [Roseovarius sp.]|uniref:hypothetical protein n=1 Tax=Roseovarius sp. TaxID=1486281 RepID=UPI003D106EA1
MRLGVVCEGPTDFHAIECFFGYTLQAAGKEVEFIALQPKMDNSAPEGGWGNVLLWLKNNPPSSRLQQFFKGGLFGGEFSLEPLDGILLQLDSDILGEPSFSAYMQKEYDYVVSVPTLADERADEVRSVLSTAAKLSEVTKADQSRHILTAAVESTEAWCVAAFKRPPQDFELLAGQDLIDCFMCALATSEGNVPDPPYAKVDKQSKRRRQFCESHAGSSERIVETCAQFRKAHEELLRLT